MLIQSLLTLGSALCSAILRLGFLSTFSFSPLISSFRKQRQTLTLSAHPHLQDKATRVCLSTGLSHTCSGHTVGSWFK